MKRKTIIIGDEQHEKLKKKAKAAGFPNLNEYIRHVLYSVIGEVTK